MSKSPRFPKPSKRPWKTAWRSDHLRDEKHLFDLNGYLVLRDVVDRDTIRRCNKAIDHYDDQIEIHERRFEGKSKALTSDIRQRWSDEMVAWERPYCELIVQSVVEGPGVRIETSSPPVVLVRGRIRLGCS